MGGEWSQAEAPRRAGRAGDSDCHARRSGRLRTLHAALSVQVPLDSHWMLPTTRSLLDAHAQHAGVCHKTPGTITTGGAPARAAGLVQFRPILAMPQNVWPSVCASFDRRRGRTPSRCIRQVPPDVCLSALLGLPRRDLPTCALHTTALRASDGLAQGRACTELLHCIAIGSCGVGRWREWVRWCLCLWRCGGGGSR